MSTKTETPQGVGTEDLLAEVVRLRAENIRLIEDRARFPDRPDDIGRIIGAHVENLKAAAAHNEEAWRWACTRETVLRNEIKRTLTENAHLTDGENCTLARLKKLVPEWESEFLANDAHEPTAGHGGAGMSFGTALKKLRVAAGQTVEQAAKAEGVSPRLWAYWEADKKLPPRERDALTRERLLDRWKTKTRPPGPSNKHIT